MSYLRCVTLSHMALFYSFHYSHAWSLLYFIHRLEGFYFVGRSARVPACLVWWLSEVLMEPDEALLHTEPPQQLWQKADFSCCQKLLATAARVVRQNN